MAAAEWLGLADEGSGKRTGCLYGSGLLRGCRLYGRFGGCTTTPGKAEPKWVRYRGERLGAVYSVPGVWSGHQESDIHYELDRIPELPVA